MFLFFQPRESNPFDFAWDTRFYQRAMPFRSATTEEQILGKFQISALSNLESLKQFADIPDNGSAREFVQRITTRITGLKDEYPVKSYGQLRSDSQNAWISLLLTDQNEFLLVADRDVKWFLNDAAELSYKEFAHSLHQYAKTTPQIVDEHSSFISFLLLAAVIYSIGRLEVQNLLEKVGDSDLANPAILDNLDYLHALENVVQTYEQLGGNSYPDSVEYLETQVQRYKKTLNDLFTKLGVIEKNRYF